MDNFFSIKSGPAICLVIIVCCIFSVGTFRLFTDKKTSESAKKDNAVSSLIATSDEVIRGNKTKAKKTLPSKK